MPKFPPIKQPYVPLSEGETVVIQADDPQYDRGLVVKLTGRGGYDLAYWYDKPTKIYPAEIKIDGRSITKDGLVVHVGYHPELAKYVSTLGNPQIIQHKGSYILGGALLGKVLFNKPLAGALVGFVLSL